MKNEYLIVNDERVIDKIEELLSFDEVNIVLKVDTGLIIDSEFYAKKNLKDYYTSVQELRGFLFSELLKTSEIDEWDKCIDNFLFLLRVDKQEASMCLERFLDVILTNISMLYKENCFKRLTCILYVIYEVQFSKDKDKKEVYDLIFDNNIYCLREEDKDYLINILVQENEYYKLVSIIMTYCEWDKESALEELPSENSANVMFEKFKYILNEYLKYTKNGVTKYEDMYNFIDTVNASYIGKNLKQLILRFADFVERILLQCAFLCGKREVLLSKEKELSSFINNCYYPNILYNYAQFYKVESRKAEGSKRTNYLNEAEFYINKAIDEKEKLGKKSPKKLTDIQFRKSEIIAEAKDYSGAYDIILQVINNPNNKFIKFYKSPYSYYLFWISAHYLRMKKCEDDTINKVIKILDDVRGHNDFFHLKEFESIVDFIDDNLFIKNHPEIRVKIYSNLIIMMGCADLILRKSKIWDVSKYTVLYYTGVNNLRYLLEDEKEDIKYRLPIFHANHMNDPEEGKILKNILNEYVPRPIKENSEASKREKYNENYVFFKSFFVSENFNEFLPMWVQYGDDAKGVCVLLDSSTFNKVDLHRINYINDYGKCVNNDEIDELIEDYKKAYKEIIEFCDCDLEEYEDDEMKEEFKEKIEELLEYINSRIIYLFKHESYMHEKEARIIVSKKSSELDDVKTISGEVPKLYVYSDYQAYIDEIILGSKMEVPDDFVPFIHYHGRKMWENNDKKKQITVSNSSIQYR